MTTTRKHWAIFWLAWAVWLIASVAVARAADVSLEWDANTEADLAGYNLTGASLTTGVPAYRASILAPFTAHTASGLVPGASYIFTLTAFTSTGLESGPSNAVSYTVPVPIPPPAPIVLTHDADAKSLRWTDPLAPPPPQVASYVVQHAPPGGQWADAATIQGSDYTMPAGLAAGEHRYRVAKLIQGKPGDWSNTITLAVPEPPRNLRVALQISTDLKTWQTVAEHNAGDGPRVFARAVFAH